mgnify:FL=1
MAEQLKDCKFNMSKLTKVFVGDSNWDIYSDDSGTLYSIGKPERRGVDAANMDTFFGNKSHIKRLIDNGHFSSVPTEAGLELMSGLHSVMCTPPRGKQFHILRF